MSLKTQLIILVIVAIVASGITRYYFPSIQTKTEVIEKEVVRTDIRTITKTVVKPDGTSETVTESIDKSVVKSDKQLSMTIYKKSNYIIGLSAGTQLSKLAPTYGVQASIRLLGPLFAGAYGRVDGEFGALISMEF